PQPCKVGAMNHIPPIHRQSPVLPCVTERVRWYSHRDFRGELLLSCPDIRAMTIDDEREVAKEQDTVCLRGLPRAAPLQVSDPLHVLLEQNATAEMAPRIAERDSLATCNFSGPLLPGHVRPLGRTRLKQRVVIEPPSLA